jgi:hypothetical protein
VSWLFKRSLQSGFILRLILGPHNLTLIQHQNTIKQDVVLLSTSRTKTLFNYQNKISESLPTTSS